MNWMRWNIVGLAFLLGGISRAQTGIVEIVPTARQEPAIWRYTFDSPVIHEWTLPDFDDSHWQSGRSPFGTRGTPGITPNTRWATRDIWLRREVTLPATLAVSAHLQLLVFHDEDAEVYFDGVLAARERGFVTEYQPIDILPGARQLLKPGAKLVVA